MTTARPFHDADYAAIEARIVAWLAGQEDALQQYRAYDAAETKEEKNEIDPYRILASQIYGIPLIDVQKFPHRLVGKHAKLGCGFQMGAPKFRGTVKKQGGYDLPTGMEETAVRGYRQANKKIVQYWYAIDDACKYAILAPGEVFVVRNVCVSVRDIDGMPFMLIKLPSGRKLAYPRPALVTERKQWGPHVDKGWNIEGSTEQVMNGGSSVTHRITFFGHIKGKMWGRVDTYGGKLVENITQAVAADIMAHGSHNVEERGFQIASIIHDQALAYYDGQDTNEYVRLLTKLPKWANGLPVAAEGGLVPFYKKD